MEIQSAPAQVDIEELAREFALSKEDLIARGLRAFVVEQLRLFQAEKQARCAKFGVASLEEMEELLVKGAVKEQEILDDFQNVDYLTARIERLGHLLETL